MRIRVRYILVVLLSCFWVAGPACAEEHPYLCEIGLQGGIGYYVGDAAPHIFMNPREAYGLHFRYKFTKRWAIQAKVSGQRITGNDFKMDATRLETKWQTQMINVDVMGEFNFLRYGSANQYDKRIKPYTPYIFLGVGVGMYNGGWWPSDTQDPNDKQAGMKVNAYIPLGIGFKWKFHERLGLNIAWQHNIFIADDLECRKALDNKHNLNGWNWMNCDLTGIFTVGIVFEFGRAKTPCRICNAD